MKVEYEIDGEREEFETDEESPWWIARSVASEYYDNDGQNEDFWPLQVEIFFDGESAGKFGVELEYEPEFTPIERESEETND